MRIFMISSLSSFQISRQPCKPVMVSYRPYLFIYLQGICMFFQNYILSSFDTAQGIYLLKRGKNLHFK